MLGTANIIEVREDAIVLGDPKRFARAITPYRKGNPSETDEVAFLREHFGEEFAPLGDVQRAVYRTARRPPVTVAEVPEETFDAVVARARP
ncbi:MAG TPA: hypothetical protein VGB13_09060 [Candidatus Krumholzibacteria bacterium]